MAIDWISGILTLGSISGVILGLIKLVEFFDFGKIQIEQIKGSGKSEFFAIFDEEPMRDKFGKLIRDENGRVQTIPCNDRDGFFTDLKFDIIIRNPSHTRSNGVKKFILRCQTEQAHDNSGLQEQIKDKYVDLDASKHTTVTIDFDVDGKIIKNSKLDLTAIDNSNRKDTKTINEKDLRITIEDMRDPEQ